MKRKLESLFDKESPEDEELNHHNSNHSNNSNKLTSISTLTPTKRKVEWKLESIDLMSPSFSLSFNNNSNLCIIGRKDLSGSKFISTIHCEIFQNSNNELFLTSKSRYDVIYVDNTLVMKDIPILLKEQCQIRFCKGHFIFKLEKLIIEDELHLNTTFDFKDENDNQENILEKQHEEEERMKMSLEDLDAVIRTRHIRDLEKTKDICHKLLSSFYCDICLEVIASCRSCVPCGHNFCAPCITQYIAVAKGGPAKCPKCRNNVRETIPNKSIDTAISDCLTYLKVESTTCLSYVTPTTAPNITESQDITLWSTRYDENEADIKAKNKPSTNSSTASSTAIRLPILQEIDDDEDDEDEDEDLYESRFDGSAAYLEYARSGRSRCIMCNLPIANQQIRVAVTETYEYHDSNTRFLHVACIREFNRIVGNRQKIIPSRFSFHGIRPDDVRYVRNTLA